MAVREIALDTETTGLDPNTGHRVIEIGAVEMINRMPTENRYHQYINPEREVDEGAVAIHGITTESLADKPKFAEIAPAFLDFIGDAKLVIHNARFDMAFLNAELGRLDTELLPMDRAIDTLMIARRRFPGAQASLDALCRRFEIDNTHRDLHGALVDADLLASVYLELTGGRQAALDLAASEGDSGTDETEIETTAANIRPPRPHAPTEEEMAAHAAFLAGLKDPIWSRA